jgi:SAM-dependent methyltransferase
MQPLIPSLKASIRRGLRRMGYDISKVPGSAPIRAVEAPPPVSPIWPLPRSDGWTDAAIRSAFARFPYWHYAFQFEGGLSFRTSHINPGLDTDNPVRPLQRFRHFMPYVVQAAGGSLAGKRVLDIGCNGGFWSIQCALLGADVVGFDARPELVEQGKLLQAITGARNVEFKQLDFQDMSPQALGGTFDIVLNLGVLYHLPEPLAALDLTRRMSRRHILLDTAIHPADDPRIELKWEEPFDIRMAAAAGVAALPSTLALELIFRHLGIAKVFQVPVRSTDLPDVYLTRRRASWLLEV